MYIRALCSFSGNITMCKGEIRECNNDAALSDLLRAGYVEKITDKPEEIDKPEETGEVKRTENAQKPRKKAVKAVENQ